MYQVAARLFTSYLQAVTVAKENGAEVFEVREDGSRIRRWAPAAPASAKQWRMYHERLAAYAAQERAKA